MKLEDYLQTNASFQAVAHAGEIVAAKALLKAATIKRDKLRQQVEENPKRDDNNLKNDLIYNLGVINGLNWLIDLPRLAHEQLKNLPEGD